jgi:hypothetical protein
VLLGVHAICEIASEITGIGQAMIHNEASIEDVVRMAYNTPTYTYGYKLAAADTLARLDPGILRPCACRPARTGSEPGPHREPG